MLGIPDFKHGRPEFALPFHRGKGKHLPQRQNYETLLYSNGAFKHEPTEASEPLTANDNNGEFLELKRNSEAAASLNDFDTEDFCDALEKSIVEARDYSYAESMRQEKVNGDSYNGICELPLEEHHNKAMECPTAASVMTSDELQIDSHLEREQEITIMNSVQSWVDSLTPEVSYESDFSLPCSEKCAVGCEKHGRSRQRSPLHQHLGYKTPSELFERVIFSEDEEMRARTDTNSTASSSSSPKNTCQRTDVRATCLQARVPSLRVWARDAVRSHGNTPNGEEKEAQGSLARLLKSGLKKGHHSPASLKGKVVVNGHILSSTAIKHAEERAGKLRPGSYWYDSEAGFWGVEGGPCLGILPPLIEELSYPMAGKCSNGDTRVYINGRELHSKDLAVLSQRGLSEKAGMAYSLGFDGVLVDGTTGLEIKHLGKLAPTVERKGKGFGMFAGAGAGAELR